MEFRFKALKVAQKIVFDYRFIEKNVTNSPDKFQCVFKIFQFFGYFEFFFLIQSKI